MRDTIIFDMDGVIVDSEKYWHDVEWEWYSKLVPGWTKEHHKKTIGLNIGDCYDFLKKTFDIPQTKEEFLTYNNEVGKIIYQEKASLLPGFLEVVKQLKEKKFNLAIASSAPLWWITTVVDRFELAPYFNEVVSVDETRKKTNMKGKPAPDVFLYTAKLLNKTPEQCIVIEDANNGVSAAKAAGMFCIGFKNGFNENQDLSHADIVINGFGEFDLDRIGK